MNPLDKQISRLPQHFRDNISDEELRMGIEVLNALMSAAKAGGQPAATRWAARNLTTEKKAALIKIADVDDKHAGQPLKLGALIRLQLQMLGV